MRRWLEWYTDVRPTITCCQFMEEGEAGEEDEETFDCESCEYRLERARLTANDEEVLRLHSQLSGRAVTDLRLAPLVLELARLRMTQDEADVLIAKLELIHEFANPQEKDSGIGKKPEVE